MTVSEAIESFLVHCRYEKNLSPRTLSAYETDLRQFESALAPEAAADVSQVDRSHLRPYIQHLFGPYSEKTVKRKVATLKAFFGYLERDETIAVTPFRKLEVRIKETKRLPRTIPLAEVERLLRYLYSQQSAGPPRSDVQAFVLVRDTAVLETLFATGARVSEICHLGLEDVDLDDGWVRILGKGGKERVVQLCDPAIIAALGAYRASRKAVVPSEAYFFLNRHGRRLSEQSVRGLLQRHASRAGVAVPVRPHLIRHSVATLLLEEGVDIRHIQHLLGHSSIATTQIYTHVNARNQREVLATKHPRRRLRVVTA
ncbi:MAG TPA: tyrosine-type recombinase/integrase [Longimicrobium sp.]|nr:tyrosine-type recombinase/integrase [Longimicrobium sp.]